MQVKYNTKNHPVSKKADDFLDACSKVSGRWISRNKIGLEAILKDPDPGYNTKVRQLIQDFLKDPVVADYKGSWLYPVIKEDLCDMKGRPMKLGSLFIQNYNRRLDMFIVTSVGKTGGAHVNRLVDNGSPWSSWSYGRLLTKPKPEYYLIVEPSFLSDEQKECLEKVFENYPICKEGFEEQYGRYR
jgi:hypothetical protein